MNQLAQRKISKEDFRMHMRKLWLDHVYWTRLFIVSSLSELPDTKTVADRLLRNQKEIGDLIGSFYKGYEEKITQLLTQHIRIAAEFLSSFNSVNGVGNKRTSDGIRKSWYKNADDITSFMYSLNQHWNLRNALYSHLSMTESEISYRMSKNYPMEITYADEAVKQSSVIADALSNGIIQQFPSAFDGYAGGGIVNGNMNGRGRTFNNQNIKQNPNRNATRR